MLKNQQIIIAGLVVVIVGGASFFGGMKYQESKRLNFNGGNRMGQFQRGMMGQGMMGGQRGLGGAVIGEIISQDDKSITVKLDDGSSKIVLLSDSMVVSKTDTGSKSDLKTGVKVGVFGTQNSDGTISAANIQLNPMFRMGRGVMPSQSTPSAK